MKTAEKIYKNLVEDKKVILVGPGRTSNENNQHIFNEYDTVVRCGQVLPINEKYISYYGKKTDILYNSLDNHPLSGGKIDDLLDIWKKEEIKLICNTYPQKEWFYNMNILPNINKVDKHIPVKNIDDNLYFYFKQILNSRPNSGFCAFIDILSYRPKKLHIIGIDFFRSLCYEDYKPNFFMGKWTHNDFLKDLEPGPTENHDPDKQYKLYKQICNSKKHIISVDDTIKNIFENPEMDNLFGDLYNENKHDNTSQGN